jgi:hypothetical protein
VSHVVDDAPDDPFMAESLLEQVVPVLLLGAPWDPGQRHMLVRLLESQVTEKTYEELKEAEKESLSNFDLFTSLR